MRVIAAITIFFLPATFTATFFSTTFFSFNEGLDGRVYSRWLWLYFVVTLVLTAIVVVGTWLLWKGKEKEISHRSQKPISGEPSQLEKRHTANLPNEATRDYIEQAIGTLPTHS
jgi:flagellar basal body-associated protein FliL